MSTTLHLLLGGIPPHSFPTQFITRDHMLALHRALLEWLIQGNPPDLWNRGCLNRGILPPQGTCTCPYDCLSIVAVNLLPKGQLRLNPCSPLGALPVPPILGTTLVVTPLHSLPLTGAPMNHSAKDNPHRAHDDPDLEKGTWRPPLSAHRAPTSRSSPLLWLFSNRGLHSREAVVKRVQSIRVRVNKRLHQSMLKDHWPELRPTSLSVYHRTKALPPPIPRSLPSLGLKRDSSHMIRHDPPKEAHSPSRTPH
jgi:hypothetical protein